ncbi:hypothetical protein B23_0960 [Geobacillus thermoleovorans B23]|nr:hypothetical protein B23_0960 [Geobacillus thermoleovorans B23]
MEIRRLKRKRSIVFSAWQLRCRSCFTLAVLSQAESRKEGKTENRLPDQDACRPIIFPIPNQNIL